MSTSLDIKLPENLTIVQAHALHDEFEALLDKGSCEQIVMHAEAVNRADTAGVQLLLALMQASQERHIEVVWDKPSEKLQEVVSVLGLNAQLGLH